MLEQITLTVESALLVKAEQRAAAENCTLDELLLMWLSGYANRAPKAGYYEELMTRLSHVESGTHFSRDEMNQLR